MINARTMLKRTWQSVDLLVISAAAATIGAVLLLDPLSPASVEHGRTDRASSTSDDVAAATRAATTMPAATEQQDRRSRDGRQPATMRRADTANEHADGVEPTMPDDRRAARSALTEDQLDEAMKIIGELYPERAARLQRLREHNPQAFERALSQNARGIVGLVLIKARNPELYELKLQELRIERQIEVLVERLRTASPGQRDEIIDQIRPLVYRQVNLGLAARGRELLMLEEHIKAMRENLLRDSQNLDQTVTMRLQRIIRNAGR